MLQQRIITTQDEYQQQQTELKQQLKQEQQVYQIAQQEIEELTNIAKRVSV